MSHLQLLSKLAKASFQNKIKIVFEQTIVNEDQAASMLNDLVWAELSNGWLGDAAVAVLGYEEAKDWLQTLFVTAISLTAQKRAPTGLDIEGFFLDAWLESGRTRALSLMFHAAAVEAQQSGDYQRLHAQIIPIFTAATSSDEAKLLYRIALSRHILVMTEKLPNLLPESGLFALLQ